MKAAATSSRTFGPGTMAHPGRSIDQEIEAFLPHDVRRQEARRVLGVEGPLEVRDEIELLEAGLKRLKLRIRPAVFRQAFPNRLGRECRQRMRTRYEIKNGSAFTEFASENINCTSANASSLGSERVRARFERSARRHV